MATTAGSTLPAVGRLVNLDLLRAAALALVLGRHMSWWDTPDSWPSPARALFDAWKASGWVGVDLFFVLSGFLVSGLLFAEYQRSGQLSVTRFYTRRGWKIYPPFFAMIATTVALRAASGKPPPWRHVVAECCFIQPYSRGLWYHTWSLGVEEHFYLLLPLLLSTLTRIAPGATDPFGRRLLNIVGVWAAVSLGMRIVNDVARPEFDTLIFRTHLRLDSLFFGVAIGYFYHFRREWFVYSFRRHRWTLLVAGWAVLILLPWALPLETSRFTRVYGMTTNYLASGAILAGALLIKPAASLASRMIAAIGQASYSIYLWHLAFQDWVVTRVAAALGEGLPLAGRIALFLAGSVAIGLVMARAVEWPSLRLRDRWLPPSSLTPGSVIRDQRMESPSVPSTNGQGSATSGY